MHQLELFDDTKDFDFQNPYKLAFKPEILKAFQEECPTVLLSISGGKDSNAMTYAVLKTIEINQWNIKHVELLHADLGAAEHPQTEAYILEFRKKVGLPLNIAYRYRADGQREDLIQQIERRADEGEIPFADLGRLWCSSNHKRGPCNRFVTPHEGTVIMVMGLRGDESTRRQSMPVCRFRPSKMPTKSRTTYDWLPLHEWSEDQVWDAIEESGWGYHPMYDGENTVTGVGNNRLSCAMCILADPNDLRNGAYSNPETYARLCRVEMKTKFSYQRDRWLCSIAPELLPDDVKEQWEEFQNAETTRMLL